MATHLLPLLTCSRWTLVQRPRRSIVTLAKHVFHSRFFYLFVVQFSLPFGEAQDR